MAEKSTKTKRVNCAACNKPLRRVKRYYRNGKYFCNIKCFKAFDLKAKQEKAAQAAQAQPPAQTPSQEPAKKE